MVRSDQPRDVPRRVFRTLFLAIPGGLLVLSACLLTGLLAVQSRNLRIVIRSSQPRSALTEAQQTWEDGHYLQSGPQFARAGLMVADSNVRWRVARLIIARSDVQFRAGEAEGGFQSCRTARRLMGIYDGRLRIDETCWDRYMLYVKTTRAAGQAQ